MMKSVNHFVRGKLDAGGLGTMPEMLSIKMKWYRCGRFFSAGDRCVGISVDILSGLDKVAIASLTQFAGEQYAEKKGS